jgi:hypothetical protein
MNDIKVLNKLSNTYYNDVGMIEATISMVNNNFTYTLVWKEFLSTVYDLLTSGI